ncbi:MAG: putative porin, partial [Bacteroidota bacterium]
MKRFLILLSFLLAISANIIADSHDTVSSPLKIKKFLMYYHFSDKAIANYVDTMVQDVQKFIPTVKWNNFYADLGNNGQASRNIEAEATPFGFFENTSHAYTPFLFSFDSAHYFSLSAPYTNIMYSFGQTKDNFLDLTHSQQINSQWNAGLNYRIVNSLGLYLRQRTDISNFSFQTNYNTKNYRLKVWANYIYNKIIDFENGGIASDSLFENNIVTRRDAMPVNLLDARNEFTQNMAFLKSTFSLNPINQENKTIRQQFFPGNLAETREPFIARE